MKRFANYYKTSLWLAMSLCLAHTAGADSGAAPITVSTAVPGATAYTAKANNINIRSRPTVKSEILGQIKKGERVEVLETKSAPEGKTRDWLRIGLPADANSYVHSVLLKDAVVTTDAVNIRCGPGLNFKDIGKLDKGQKVEVIKVEGDWTRIKPPAHCTGWVAAEFFEAIAPVPAAPPAIITSQIEPPVVPLQPPAPLIETRTVEVEVEVQVQYVVKDGIFRKSDQAAQGPTPYELRTQDVERRQYRIAYLELKEGGLEKYEGKHVRVLGNERWRKGDRYPVIAVERLEQVW